MANVLVVDDNADFAELGAKLLRSDGHDTRWTTAPAEALLMVRDFSPDVLFVDFQLQDAGQDGADLARALSRMFPDLKVLLMTGLPSDSLLDRIVGIPNVKIVEKPINMIEAMKLIA